jgi:hypothetical protein
LILKTFMPIEEPQTGPIVWYGGETFPTIGTFYTEIQRLLREIQPTISMPRQVPFRDLSFPETELHAVDSVDAAIAEIEKIKVQGEGTSSSPLVEPGTDEYSHYARFGEIYWRHELEQVGPDRWSYTGPRIDYPEEIYPVARIPAEGYPESDEFNRTYTSMLNNLQNAWTTGGAAGTPFISHARTDMVQMRSLGVDLMRREITPGGKHFGPTFRLVSP